MDRFLAVPSVANAGGRGPLPIVVGIAGHRNMHPDDAHRLADAVREKLTELLKEYPHTPLLLLSPLAAGADRLAGAVAQELKAEGVDVVVPMPFETAEYQKDFDEADPTGNLSAQFHAMVEKARCSYSVGFVSSSGGPTLLEAPDADLSDKRVRARQYAQVGAYIARNSQLLIALWDAVPTSNLGGTAQIVQFKITGYAEGFGPKPAPLDVPESSPVYHIPTRRDTDDPLPVDCQEPKTIWPHGGGSSVTSAHQRVHEKVLERIERFNVDALNCRNRKQEGVSTAAIREAVEMLADRNRRRTRNTLTALFVGALIATCSFIAYAHAYQHQWRVLGLDLVATLLAVLVYRIARTGEFQSRYQDYRAVVEGLRVQSNWHRANLRETVADHYMRQHRSDLDWIRNAIRVCRVLDDTARPKAVKFETERRCIIENVRKKWVDSEIVYLMDRKNAERRMHQVFRAIAMAMLCASVVLVAFVLAGVSNAIPQIAAWVGKPDESPWKWFIVAISVTAVLSGLAESFADKRAFRVHAKQYRRMEAHFQRARVMLDELLAKQSFNDDAYREAQGVIRDLGIEALAENGAWVMLHRERPVEFVHGG